MTQDRETGVDWHEADRLFAELLELPAAERSEGLQRRAAGNPDLLAAVSRLLEAERQSASAFDARAGALGELLEEALTQSDQAGEDEVPEQLRRLGPYRLLRLLGRGGMSSVWLAERADGEFQRLVAIKLLRQWVDGAEAARRFMAERQILSSLSHANIAALLDGGTMADGTPWLAMEYIEGETLTGYSRSRRLGLEARLDLFVQVADAVHHAHRKLVVHRDLKPGNVLVGADGRVKLLDFGIAKLLEPDGMPGGAPMTRAAYHPMTPEYAAPEQVLGEPVSTATDVYQLGVLLYELLCDQRPARPRTDGAGAPATLPPSQVVRTRGGGPAAGGNENRIADATLARRLRGDLDLIVLKALKREPEQRYSSAAALAEDIRNHLRGRAISIRPESGLEAARRYFRRRPWAAVALALGLGLAVTAQISAVRFSQQRDAAQREAQRVAQVRDLTIGLFRQADPVSGENIRGRDTTVWDSVDAATRRIRQELYADPKLRAEMLATLGTLQHYAGHMTEGVELLSEAAALHRELDGPRSAPYAVALAELGRQQSKLGALEAADAAVQEAMGIVTTLPRGAEDARLAVLLDAAEVLETLGRLEDSERTYRAAIALASTSPERMSARIAAANGLGQVLSALGHTADAAALTQETIALIERELGPDSTRLVVPLANLGGIQRLEGNPEAAVRNLQRALELQRAAYGDAHESTHGLRNNLILALAAEGRHEEALAEMRILVAQQRTNDNKGRHQYAGNLQNLAVLLVLAGRQDEALGVLEEARGELVAAYPQGHFRQAFPLMTQAFIRLRRSEPQLAEPLAREALEILSVQLPAGHHVLGIARCLVGEAMLGTGLSEEAAAILAEALPLAQQGPRNMLPYVDNCERALAAVSPRPPAEG